MNYETVIGLEVHAELKTKTKIYCGCSTEFGGEVNTHTCPICVGFPGVLPVLNKQVVEYAIKAGLATNCNITPVGKQDRKNYFYPDLPKAYQTSQYDLPICVGGYVEIETEDGPKKIRLTRIHIEEDAGKLLHDFGEGTLVDYNRGGVPLIEIVSEPDLRSSQEAHTFLEQLKAILEYTDVSDCKMQEGSLRCDVNVSVRPEGATEFGIRTEMKNVNSFRAAVRAIEYESKRQIAVLENGDEVTQETRRWDEASGKSVPMRSKEDAQDYRYFPEPDLVNIVIDDEWVARVRETLPELPQARIKRYIADLGLTDYDAGLIASNKKLAVLFEETVALGAKPKAVSNWILGDVSRILNERDIELDESKLTPQALASLIELIEKGTISNNAGKKVLPDIFDGCDDVTKLVEEKGLVQISDDSALMEIVTQVLADNEKSVNDYKGGNERAIGFLVGQCMKASKGKGNPQKFNELLKQNLG
ncbi:MAG: Asp-tRNA(Asn)/Glu-tRNA(Gln) amidotransferase subunit GatB [Clostridiales bacterium]|jgi:aspartyl-tRNA(Asn)/glutamyl-tRNA(Gln) amidotransferase subunit B|nr:Asp-tRNA(Asn)/Glu-tRNA(Gln) amidotransferase subunit GatB [Clostridiales bacterium]